MGLNVSIESRPVTALSWFPRMRDKRFERPDFLDGFVGGSAVADQVAEADVPVDPVLLGEFQKGVQGLEVAVDIAEDQCAHDGSLRPRSNEAWSVWA